MANNYQRIIIKIGSNVLTQSNGLPDVARIGHLADQVAAIKKQGKEVILVSSGAVASGRSLINIDEKVNSVAARQLLASIGQVKLINTYAQLFEAYQMLCSQVLVTKEDFRDRMHYLNMKNCLEILLQHGVIPVVNENDVVSVTELMFTDNDELAGLIASMLNAQALIILSNVDGLYNGDPKVAGSKVIEEIDGSTTNFASFVSSSRSSFGRGGMLTKSNMAQKVATLGIAVHIANGTKDNILTDVLAGKTTHTKFIPSKNTSGKKKWIAHSQNFAKGVVEINEGAKTVLTSSKATSLLPVGIVTITADFQKGDIIKLVDEAGKQIGLGIAEYGSDKARERIGQKEPPPTGALRLPLFKRVMNYQTYFENARNAGRTIAGLDKTRIDQVLLDLADATEASAKTLLEENQKDLGRMDKADPKYDRLKLTEQRIADIANEIRNVAALDNPVGELLSAKTLPNGLHLSKVRVPMGVVGVIYEARPNVTFDVFSLCFKTGNVAVLKGGSDAEFSNKAIIEVIHRVLNQHNINNNVATLLPPEREATEALLNAVGFIDVLIPRGSQSLINFVRQNSKVPVIETGAGIVHTYADESADITKLAPIVFNSKTRRPSVCNTLDCLILHQSLLNKLPEITATLAEKEVEIFADEQSYQALAGQYPAALLYPAQPEHFGTEFLALKMAIKTVGSFTEALDHIAQYSSKHSEAIISENPQNIETFLNTVDAAAVYANASTAFTDGAQFGLGAEIGISTQKLHARGPMGLAELTSYKWIVRGDGQVRG